MTISYSKPRLRLRFVLLAALAAVAMGMGTFGAAEARAHGSCSFPTLSVFKSNGQIVGRAVFECTLWHRNLNAMVHIERFEGGQWVRVSDIGEGNAPGRQAKARTTTACAETDNYRAVGLGTSGDETTTSPHIVQKPGSSTVINCTSSDLTNTSGGSEAVNSRLAGMLGGAE
jgi:hypothetical protein